MDFQLRGDAPAGQEHENRPIQIQPDIQVTHPTPRHPDFGRLFSNIGRLSSVLQYIVD
ncbi:MULTISPECIES: hypothetical protein [unclassified Paraburkholderia]|uniref:hypothetical protein n=1 Tax=unclassified Paraburkholderia TaxID=2615204 RepID=UPI001622EDFC|nr:MULTISPECIES: hypothetical protein [unclassified Paraburkholderia]MBB5448055.1 hypothetical protein [Paraburkholderia sp. WSM4177]MBB5488470.1 hypothetical protein [Paraburkholderia sp. WSM4180]